MARTVQRWEPGAHGRRGDGPFRVVNRFFFPGKCLTVRPDAVPLKPVTWRRGRLFNFGVGGRGPEIAFPSLVFRGPSENALRNDQRRGIEWLWLAALQKAQTATWTKPDSFGEGLIATPRRR